VTTLNQPQQSQQINDAAQPSSSTTQILSGRLPPLAAWYTFAAAALMAALIVVVALLGESRALALLTLLALTLAVNLGGGALARRGSWPGLVNWLIRLSNLAAISLANLLLDGLYSPLVPMYAEDILSASLRDGKRGAWTGWGLVTVALLGVALCSWPLDDAEIQRLLISIAVMGAITLLAGQVGTQRLEMHVALARQSLENERLYAELEERTQRLSEAYKELKELDRRKTEFAQGISHELRTPLSFIRGYIELLRDGGLGELSDLQREKLDIVAQKIISLADLVRDVVALQRGVPRPDEMSSVSLAELARQAVAGAEATAHEQGIELRLDLPAAPLNVRGDFRQLEQVFTNLLGNAIKFSPDGGTITVGAQQEDERVVVFVNDEGIGVPPEEQQRIFERFYQVDSAATRHFSGSGLGLTIVKEFVEGFGGQVWLTSPTKPGDPAHGSTFYFALPQL
jgi:signal transduction histidine kinase